MRSTSSRISAGLGGHDNNFNAIRAAAALLVLISHSFVVVSGSQAHEPWRLSHGLTPGAMAVDVFFVLSGLLVTQSLVSRRYAFEFVKARLLRVWPGLIVSLIVVVYLLGSALTTLPLPEYLASPAAFNEIVKGAIFANGMGAAPLPGVFDGNPYGRLLNASLWTLPVEVRMYTYLLTAWLLTWLMPRHRLRLLGVIVLAAIAFFGARHFLACGGTLIDSRARLPMMFFIGSAACLFARRVVLSDAAALLALIALLMSAVVGGPVFYVVYSLTLWYLVLWSAYRPAGWLRRYNRFGDYSYGLYIYAWPVQQAAIWLIPGLDVPSHIALSIAATLPLAVVSWYLIEKPALRLKSFDWRRARGVAPAGPTVDAGTNYPRAS